MVTAAQGHAQLPLRLHDGLTGLISLGTLPLAVIVVNG